MPSSGQPPALAWESLRWRDGTTYEGVSRGGTLEGPGVMTWPDGSRYEGEWEGGAMQGFGAYVWRDGAIFRGEWEGGAMHGCGVWMRPEAGGRVQAKEGHFLRDAFLGEGLACPADAAQLAAAEADAAAARAAKFRLEPAWLSK